MAVVYLVGVNDSVGPVAWVPLHSSGALGFCLTSDLLPTVGFEPLGPPHHRIAQRRKNGQRVLLIAALEAPELVSNLLDRSL